MCKSVICNAAVWDSSLSLAQREPQTELNIKLWSDSISWSSYDVWRKAAPALSQNMLTFAIISRGLVHKMLNCKTICMLDLMAVSSSKSFLFQIRVKVMFTNSAFAKASLHSGSIHSWSSRILGFWLGLYWQHQVKSGGFIRNGLILSRTVWNCLHLGWVNPWVKVEWLVSLIEALEGMRESDYLIWMCLVNTE